MSIFDDIEKDDEKNEVKVSVSAEEYENVASFFNMLDFEKKEEKEEVNEEITASDIKKTGILMNGKKLLVHLGFKQIAKPNPYIDFAYSCVLLIAVVISKKKKAIKGIFTSNKKGEEKNEKT